MKYNGLTILLPCHSLEDFPVHHEDEDAQGLLAGWSALWHPSLIASVASLPAWRRVDDPLDSLVDQLIVIPSVSESELPTGFVERAAADGATVLRGQNCRDEIVADALATLDDGDSTIDADLAADFLALGYCFLQVQLLTRHMRYSSNLDEQYFENQLVAAAQAAAGGDSSAATNGLATCFDTLSEERNHYYPVDAFIIDLTLVASSTIGTSLRDELDRRTPINLLLSGSVVDEMATREAASLSALRGALEDGNACIVGGEYEEHRLPLLDPESILAGLRRGLDTYHRHLGTRPDIFGRRQFGLTPLLPQILSRLSFSGVLHATLDDGSFPESSQSKTRWEGIDGTFIESYARAPRDASRPGTFLNYSIRLGESMDMDQVATVCLAHWPGQVPNWLDDLRRIARYAPVLGKFVTLREYLDITEYHGHQDGFSADQYRAPYLKQAIIRGEANPISDGIEHYHRRAAGAMSHTLETLASLVSGNLPSEASDPLPEDVAAPEGDAATDDRLANATARLAACLPRAASATTQGYLIFNPCSFSRRAGIVLPAMETLPSPEKPIYSTSAAAQGAEVVVELPPTGFAWVEPGNSVARRRSRRAEKPLAAENLLRNEFMEVHFNDVTGSLDSLYDYHTRGNRLSQQLAMRLGSGSESNRANSQDQDDAAIYSVMAADGVDVVSATPTKGEICSRGRLLNQEGKLLAKFAQTYRLWRGLRVLEIDIELDIREEPRADPRNSYYACRFAWADPGAELSRNVGFSRQACSTRHFEAPMFVELDMPQTRTAILTGGIAYHRRAGSRMLDSLLVVRGETRRRFQLGIGLDLDQPLQSALGMLAPPAVSALTNGPPAASASSWLFHLDCKNVVVTHWEPQVDASRVTGFRVRLHEIAGRPAELALSSFRSVQSARRVDWQGETLDDAEVNGEKIRLRLAPHEWTEVVADWS